MKMKVCIVGAKVMLGHFMYGTERIHGPAGHYKGFILLHYE